MKYIRKINERVVLRPTKNHPYPAYWEALREQVIELQNGECGTCAIAPGTDLHHRHYDNFGCEALDDVILLCRPCHKAITSRIRDARYAAGEGDCDSFLPVTREERFRRVSGEKAPPPVQVVVEGKPAWRRKFNSE